MRRIVACFSFILFGHAAFSQYTPDSISETEVKKVIQFLAHDSLKGRGNYTPQLHQAANFIAEEFDKYGLRKFPISSSFLQRFTTKPITKKEREDSNWLYDPQKVLLNVISVLPGKSLAYEAVIFSAHYDHLGPDDTGSYDSIYNGANDNASGTTALLVLANYFAKRADNERTIIFCAFSGEELGLLGSGAFVNNVNADSIIAVINIEMIGAIRPKRKNSFFITGASYSNMQQIFKNNLSITSVKIVNEPNESKQLFKRSDNFHFALKGIPAHSIMCSDDDDGCYHQPCDDVQHIDTKNMTEIIKAIAIGSHSIIMGKDTPSRINPKKIIKFLLSR